MHGKIFQRDKKTLDFQNESCILIIELIIREKNMTNETVFIDAENGGVGVYIGAGNKVGWAKTAKTLKYILDTKNINVFEDRLFFSSSMDFANEYGFETHDGAKEIFYTAQRMIQDEIVANGQFACDFDG